MRYPVVIHKDPNSDYGVTVPDLPGCFSAGATMDEALSNAVEAIECHVEGLMLDAEPVPSPKTVESHKDNIDFAGGIWALVDVDLTKLSGKARRVNVTIPERVLSLIDDYASGTGRRVPVFSPRLCSSSSRNKPKPLSAFAGMTNKAETNGASIAAIALGGRRDAAYVCGGVESCTLTDHPIQTMHRRFTIGL